jgi:hypothetical protein
MCRGTALPPQPSFLAARALLSQVTGWPSFLGPCQKLGLMGNRILTEQDMIRLEVNCIEVFLKVLRNCIESGRWNPYAGLGSSKNCHVARRFTWSNRPWDSCESTSKLVATGLQNSRCYLHRRVSGSSRLSREVRYSLFVDSALRVCLY